MSIAQTRALLLTPQPDEMLAAVEHHLRQEHETHLETGKDGSRFVDKDGFCVTFQTEEKGLQISLRAPHEGMLVLLRDQVVQHVHELSPEAASDLRWEGFDCALRDYPSNFRIGTLIARSRPVTGLLRLQLQVDDIPALGDGLHLKVMLPSQPSRAPAWPRLGANGGLQWPKGKDALHVRYLTIRATDPKAGLVWLDVVDHGDGLMSTWAATAKVGSTIGLMGPTGTPVIPQVERVFLAADQTAMPVVARMIETLPPQVRGTVVAECDSAEEARSYFNSDKLEIVALDRASFRSAILEQATEICRVEKPQYAFFAGELLNARELRAFFRGDLALGNRHHSSIGYWREHE
ncbi:hypothetical protein GFB49_17650 [Epibacterium sp. SM1979]|uniref:FAD-binding FR-type domain-containing protein n=1 Tax=Tritonibacter litoralis TaxID=2662264 RepID=A0A843YGL5_9RHOB|nr:siderophore-interacting protein [Tritonibacter litoralis]MQQ10296.1 hypothetical protein [Tritonibacter litoralis]